MHIVLILIVHFIIGLGMVCLEFVEQSESLLYQIKCFEAKTYWMGGVCNGITLFGINTGLKGEFVIFSVIIDIS